MWKPSRSERWSALGQKRFLQMGLISSLWVHLKGDYLGVGVKAKRKAKIRRTREGWSNTADLQGWGPCGKEMGASREVGTSVLWPRGNKFCQQEG